MVLDFLGGKASVELDTDDIAYRTGTFVRARARIEAVAQQPIQEARVELIYANRYEYQVSSGRSGSSHRSATDESVIDQVQVLPAGTLQPGHASEHVVELAVPSQAPPSAEGEITQVRWHVRAVLAIRLRPDIAAEVPITVLSPRDTYAAWAEQRPWANSNACDMSFELSTLHIRTGQRLTGVLAVTPREDFDVDESRVELVCREEVARARGKEAERVESSAILAGAGRFEVGRSPQFPFELLVPSGACPCLETAQSTVRWAIRAILSRRLRADFRLIQPLNVFTAPPEA